MGENRDRKWRLQQLLHKQKMKRKTDFGELFNECVEALGEGCCILSEGKTEEIYNHLQASYPFSPWSRIDWEKVKSRFVVDHLRELETMLSKEHLPIEDEVFILWSYGNFPVLQTQLHKAIKAIDDVLAVSSDTFIFSPSRFVIEFFHEGEITLGIIDT